MAAVLSLFAGLPGPVQIALLGLAGGAVGVGLSHLAGRWTSHRGLLMALVVVPVIGTPALVNGVIGRRASDGQVSAVMEALRQAPLNRAVLAADAGLETALKQRLAVLIRGRPGDAGVKAEAEALMADLAEETFNALAPDASDEAILAYMRLSLQALEQLGGRPSACVAFILGKPGFDASLLGLALRDSLAALKARIITEGAARTAPFRTPLPSDDLSQSLAIGYRMTGRDPKAGARFAAIDADPAAGCAAAIDYMTAVASLEAKRAAKVFKTLLLTRRAP